MKPIFSLALFSLSAPGILAAAEIRTAGDAFLLSGKNYTVELSRADGTIRAVTANGRDLTFDNSQEGLWKAKFLDNSTLTAKQAKKTTVKQETDRLVFTGDGDDLTATVTVTPYDDHVDFRGEFTPKKQPVIVFSSPGRLNFSPKAVDGVVCHIKGATNPGMILRAPFFSPGAQSGENSYWKQAGACHSRPAEILFGGPFRNLGDKTDHRPQTVAPGASEWFDKPDLEKLRALRITPTRPFDKGQAEIAFLTDGNGNVAAGGSRFGGRGAFLRWGAFMATQQAERTIMELTVAMIAKLKKETRFENGRHKIALIALNGEARARPALASWRGELLKAVPDIELITGAKELETALRSPETAAIINPYTEHGIAAPGKTLPETMELIRKFVQSGGYWFESHGYSFYYELKPVTWLTSELQGAPGSFADFFHFSIAGENAALYAVQPITWKPFAALEDRSAVFLPSLYEIGGEPRGGRLDRGFVVYAKPGETFRTPVSRLRFHSGALESLRGFSADNRIDRKLEDKAPAELIDKTRNSVLWHPQSWRLSREEELRKALPMLPTPVIVHLSQYLKGGFDKQYPDHLPPSPHWGTQEGFRSLVAEIRRRGMLFMPYINNTWWCDNPRGPTFLAAGEEPLQRGLDGKKIHEKYANNDGWGITMWHPAVRAANDRLVREFTETVQSDILFQDQTGVRGGVSVMQKGAIRGYDLNPASPTPYAVVEGFLSQARADAEKVPLATEEGWWGLVNNEFMMCGFSGGLCHFMAWMGDFRDQWPKNSWNIFPMVQAIAHDKTLMGHHDLAGDVRSRELISWTLALGYNMVSRADPRDPGQRQWLLWLDRIQKSVCARYAAGGVSGFRHDWGENNETGVIRAVYGPVSVVANLQRKPLRDGGVAIAPGGFFATGGGVTAGDLSGCGDAAIPGFFVSEGGRTWLYASPGEKAAFPLETAPAAIRCEGKPVEFHWAGGVASVSLPARSGTGKQVWELEMMQ